MLKAAFALVLSVAVGLPAVAEAEQAVPRHAAARREKVAVQKVIFDTDIGDDIDDAYALALLLKSPDVKVLGITTAFGNTHLRARLVSRLLQETENETIPVFAGPQTKVAKGLSQAAWALQFPDCTYPDAIAFMAAAIPKYPGQVTLISIAPLTNVGALIAKDPATFRKLKRVVMMGGSIERGYGMTAHPDAEWNIINDIPAAQALFASGVPLYVMPLDSTQILLDAPRRNEIFSQGTPLAWALQELTAEWTAATTYATPTLYDAVATAYALNPAVCPVTPMRIEVDDKGFTRRAEGTPNANVCLSSTADGFFDFYLPRLTK
jgi:purine nucleosidase